MQTHLSGTGNAVPRESITGGTTGAVTVIGNAGGGALRS